MIVQLSGESSARRMCKGGRAGSANAGPGAPVDRLALAQVSNGTAKENALPSPSLLATQMRPPINSTSCFEIVSPSPEPPNLRVVDKSACVKRSNTRLSCVSEMPMPVSDTVNRNAVGAAAFMSDVICGPSHVAVADFWIYRKLWAEG